MPGLGERFRVGRRAAHAPRDATGGTLPCVVLQSNGRMPETDAAMVVTDVLSVLAECNRQKVRPAAACRRCSRLLH